MDCGDRRGDASDKADVRSRSGRAAYSEQPDGGLRVCIRPRRNPFVLLVWPVLILAGTALTVAQIMTLGDLVGLPSGGGEERWTIRFVLAILSIAASAIVVASALLAWVFEALAEDEVIVREHRLRIRRTLAGALWRIGEWSARDVLGIETVQTVNMLFDGRPQGPLPHSGLRGSIAVVGRKGRFRFGAWLGSRDASAIAERIRGRLRTGGKEHVGQRETGADGTAVGDGISAGRGAGRGGGMTRARA